MTTPSTELSLKALKAQFNKELLEPPTKKNILEFIVKFGICFGSFIIASYSPSIWMTVLFTLIGGVFMFSLGTVGHDAGHNAYARPRWLNELVGQMSMTFHAMPYSGWKHFHDTHHQNTNCCENDPDRNWIFYDEYVKKNPIEQFFWRFFLTKGFFLISLPHFVRVMWPWCFFINKHTDNKTIQFRVWRDTALTIAVLAGMQYFMVSQVGYKSLIIHFVMVVMGLIGLSIYVRTQHYHLQSGYDMDDKPWLTSRTIFQGPVYDFFANNLNYHIEHHILPTVPHANLPKVQPQVQKFIEDSGSEYIHDFLPECLARYWNTEFTVMDRETMREIPLKEAEATLQVS